MTEVTEVARHGVEGGPWATAPVLGGLEARCHSEAVAGSRDLPLRPFHSHPQLEVRFRVWGVVLQAE